MEEGAEVGTDEGTKEGLEEGNVDEFPLPTCSRLDDP